MSVCSDIPIGASSSRNLTVSFDMTVAKYHPEMPEVLGTPIMIYLMEVAAADAIEKHLPEGWVSVGALVNVKHLAATPVGARVTATAEVIQVDENTVTFRIEAHDGVEKIGEGTHVRAPINLERFMRRAAAKKAQMEISQ